MSRGTQRARLGRRSCGRVDRAWHALALTFGLAACAADDIGPGGGPLGSEQGRFVAVIELAPAPPRVGNNALLLELADRDEVPVSGAALSVFAWMPAHGHSMTTEPTATESKQGVYVIEPMGFSMPGRWEVSIDIAAAGVEDRLTIPIDVR